MGENIFILELGEITKEVLAFLHCLFLKKIWIFRPLWDKLALSQEMLWHHITGIGVSFKLPTWPHGYKVLMCFSQAQLCVREWQTN